MLVQNKALSISRQEYSPVGYYLFSHFESVKEFSFSFLTAALMTKDEQSINSRLPGKDLR